MYSDNLGFNVNLLLTFRFLLFDMMNCVKKNCATCIWILFRGKLGYIYAYYLDSLGYLSAKSK